MCCPPPAFDMGLFGRYRYELMKPGDRWTPGAKATLCNRCGDCLPRCPQGLAIPDLLFQAHQLFMTPIGTLS